MVDATAQIRGLPEFRRELKALGPDWPRQLRKVHKTIADEAARRSRAFAGAMGGIQAKSSGAIRARANQREARVSVIPSSRAPMANVAFWGAKRHTGWYAKPQYASGPAQHPPWVGNAWDVAEFGQGPYAINPALAAYKPILLDEYADMIDDLARRAFPER